MDNASAAFLAAFQQGMSRRQREEERERERQAQKGLADLIAKDSQEIQAATKDRLMANQNYQFGQSTNSLNDLLPKSDISLSNNTPQQIAPAPQFSLNSLLDKPQTPQPMNYVKGKPMQQMDFNRFNSLVAKGVEGGLDYSTASKMVGNYKGMHDEQYNKQKEETDWDSFSTLKTPQEKLLFAAKNKMPMDAIKMLMSPDVETQVVDIGGVKKVVGRNKYTNSYTDMMTGKPLTADDLKVTMTEYQQRSLDDANYRHNTPSASTVYAANNRVGTSGDRYIDVPGLGRMTPAQVLSAYRQARGGVVETDDGYGGVKRTTKPADPDVLRILEPIVKQVRGELNLPPIVQNTGNAKIDAQAQTMRAAGADESLIQQMVDEEIAKSQPNQRPRYTVPTVDPVPDGWLTTD